jgi:predicted dehydrogenase
MIEAAETSGCVLATAHNNRHDPMNRLARACVESGLIGAPTFALQVLTNPGGNIIATAWRHKLAMGGVLLDVAVHTGYELEYIAGEVETITAQAQLVQTHREGAEFDGTAVSVDPDAEDCFSALLTFTNGAQGQWTGHFASFGESMFKRLITGTEGTVDCPSGRSGQPVVVHRRGLAISEDALVRNLPDYSLNHIETVLFGERPGAYQLESAVTDRKLIAAELHDFAEAVRTGRSPETDAQSGLRAIALIYGVLESSLAGRTVTMDDILDGSLHAYQDRVEAATM